MDVVFREGLEEAMTNEGFDAPVISQLLSRYEDVRYAKTDSRKVLGSMNDLASMYKHHYLLRGGTENCDLPAAILKMNRVPFSPLGGRYAIEKFSGLLGIERKISIEKLISAPWSGGANAGPSPDEGAVYQIMVTLRESEPAIWRRLLVQDTTLNRLSDFLIASMGWMGGHLHIFTPAASATAFPIRNGTTRTL